MASVPGRQARDRAIRTQLRSHATLSAIAPPNQDHLIRSELRKSETPKRFHVHENIRCPFTPSQEAKAANPVEPFDAGPFPVALGRHLHVGPLRQLRGMDRRAFVHAENAEGLQASWALEHLTVYSGALVGGLVTACPEAGDVQQDIGEPIVGHDEAIPLGNVEPLDGTGDLEDLYSGVASRPCVWS